MEPTKEVQELRDKQQKNSRKKKRRSESHMAFGVQINTNTNKRLPYNQTTQHTDNE